MFKKLYQIRNNILISNRLKFITLVVAVLVILLCVVSLQNIKKINDNIDRVNHGHIKSLVKLSGLIENIYGILLESHIVDEKSLNENAIESSVNLDLINTYLTEFEQSIFDQTQKSYYDNFLLEFQNYLNILREVNSLSLKGNFELAAQLKNDREFPSYKKLQSIVKSIMDYNYNGIQEGNKKIESLKKKAFFWVILVSLFILLFIFFLVSFILKDITDSLKVLSEHLSILHEGQIPGNVLNADKNEIGAMAMLTNKLTSNLAELNRFANEMSQGKLSGNYKPAGANDILGTALVNLRNSLIVSKEEDEKRKIDEERRNWTNQGHAIFGEILRQRSRALSQLTDDIIKNLVYYLKANQGGLFIINDTADIPKIELISAFAYDRKKFFERTINIGDGLIGTVALERNTIYLREIPEDYIEIESGLGEANPKVLLIVPLKFEEDILGIVELASFREFQDFEIKFVEEVAQSIASTLLTARINARTEQLLDESRKQSEELAIQEVESRQNMEEMRAAQELAQRREADLSGILSAVDNTLMKGEYELDGTLISVNNRHLQTMGYQLKEIKGKNIEMFVPKEELEQFRKVWANVVSGNPRQLEVRRRTKTGEILWLINQYTPVTDVTGKISKILYLAHDITRYKKSEEESVARETAVEFIQEELEKQNKELTDTRKLLQNNESIVDSIYKAIDIGQLIIELDISGNITRINNLALQLFKLSEQSAVGKFYLEVFNTDKTTNQFNGILKGLQSGTATSLTGKYTLPDNSVLWLHEIFTPVIDPQNATYKILILATDITQQKELEDLKSKLLEESNNLATELGKKQQELDELKGLGGISSAGTDPLSLQKIIAMDALDQTLPWIETDIELNIISSNKKFTEMFKYPERELINKHLSRILPVKDKDVLIFSRSDFKEGEAIEIQVNIQSRDRQLIPVSLNMIPMNLNKKGDEKIRVYVSGGDFGLAPENGLKIISDELDSKKKELKQIIEQIEQIKSADNSVNISSSSETDELYSNWLTSVKAEIKKK